MTATYASTTAEEEERKEKVRRYLEKKKRRKSDGKKTVRYVSRQRYAEARPRVRGRFVKSEPNASVERDDCEDDDCEDDDCDLDAVGVDQAGDEKEREGTTTPYTIIDAAEVTTLSSQLDSDTVRRQTPPPNRLTPLKHPRNRSRNHSRNHSRNCL